MNPLALAKSNGQKLYWTGKECPRGHIGWRLVSTRSCKICNQQRCAKYQSTHKAKMRENFQKWRAKNIEKDRANSRKWQKENRDKVIAAIAKREADIDLRIPIWANMNAIQAIYSKARSVSKKTGIPHHVDHVIPLRGKLVSGLHVETNLAVIPAELNKRKSNSFNINEHN